MKKFIILSLVIVLVLFIKFIISSSDNTCFVKYIKNPVCGNKETGTLFDPNVICIDDKLYMYVSNRTKKSIYLYISDDGFNWSEVQEVFSYNKESGWEDDINRCCVICIDGKYKMWYTGQKNGKSNIGYAESEDPFHFKRVQNEPILKHEENYEKEAVMNPYVMYDENVKIYKMWYSCGENYEPDVIAYAESQDGINWNKYKNNPIYKASNKKGEFDCYKVGACEVKKYNEYYYMFYIGYTDINTAYIMCAKSKDGITGWEKITRKPLVSPSMNSFDKDACYKPTVYYNEKTKTVMLWYNGRNKHEEYIGLATYQIN